MIRFILPLLLLFGMASSAADRITATITVTNTPSTNETLVVNGNTRTWAASLTATTPAVGTNDNSSATNLWLHLGSYPFASTVVQMTDTNKVAIIGLPGSAMVVSLTTNWGSITLSTQTITTAYAVRVPMLVETTPVRTNIAGKLVLDIGNYSPAPFATGTVAMANFMDLVNTQTVTGPKTFSSLYATGIVNRGASISSVGTGTDSEQFGSSAQATNTGALAVGQGATAGGNASMAIGNAATAVTGIAAAAIGNAASATKDDALSVGTAASASGQAAVAVGSAASASATNSIAIGTSSAASGTGAIAIGTSASSATNGIALGDDSTATGERSFAIGPTTSATHYNAGVIGYGLTSTADNTLMLGNASQAVSIAGTLEVSGGITNSSYAGTIVALSGGRITSNQRDGSTGYSNTESNTTMNGTTDISGLQLPRSVHTSLANGANAGVIFTNTFNRLTNGPSASFSIAGISGGADGRVLLIANMTGQNMTVSHDSGTEPTASNRIYTMTGSDVATTGNGSAFLIYDSNLSRWLLLDSSP